MPKRPRSKSAKQFDRDVRNRERQDKALQQRRLGRTYAQIAAYRAPHTDPLTGVKTLDPPLYASADTAYAAVQTALKRITLENAEQVIQLEAFKLDALELTAHGFLADTTKTDAVRMAAMDRLLKIQDRRAKLLGLDAKTTVKIEADMTLSQLFLELQEQQDKGAVQARAVLAAAHGFPLLEAAGENVLDADSGDALDEDVLEESESVLGDVAKDDSEGPALGAVAVGATIQNLPLDAPNPGDENALQPAPSDSAGLAASTDENGTGEPLELAPALEAPGPPLTQRQRTARALEALAALPPAPLGPAPGLKLPKPAPPVLSIEPDVGALADLFR